MLSDLKYNRGAIHQHVSAGRADLKTLFVLAGLTIGLCLIPAFAQPYYSVVSVASLTAGTMDEPYSGYRKEGYPAVSMPSKTITMGFQETGIVEEVLVTESDVVEPGMVMMRLDDEIQRWTLKAQRIQSDDMTEIESAKRQLALAEYDFDLLTQADERNSVAPRELERAKAELALSKINVRAAEIAHEQANAIYQREGARLKGMAITSRINGIVAQIDTAEGESVESSQPVIHIVSIDPLWMDVAVPIGLGLHLESGMSAIVKWRDVDGDVPVDAKIRYVSAVADAASNSIIVRLEMGNPDQLPAGLHAYARFPEAEETIRGSQ